MFWTYSSYGLDVYIQGTVCGYLRIKDLFEKFSRSSVMVAALTNCNGRSRQPNSERVMETMPNVFSGKMVHLSRSKGSMVKR